MKQIFLVIILCHFFGVSHSAPQTSWFLDELGIASTSYILDDNLGSNDGTANYLPSTGNASGKVCSALDFTNNSIQDYAVLGPNALDGATDLTISFWHKGSSTAERSFLSGARTGMMNELILWFTNGTRFNSYINGSIGPNINFPTIADNQWHHIVWRRSGTQSCLFTDSVERGCVTISNKTLAIESLILGQEQDSMGGGFDVTQDWESLVDELLVFRSALTNAEISSIYTNQNAGNTWDGGIRSCQTTPPNPPTIDYSYSDWHFDEESWNGTPNEVIDSQGVHHGYANNVTAVEGKLCNGMDLTASSSSDYANLNAASIDGATDFTVSIWHKGTSTNSKGLLSGARSTPINNEFLYWFPNATTFNGFLKNSALGNVAVGAIHNNNWNHLVWRREGAQSCFFLNSALQGCQTNLNSLALNVVSLVLGQDQDNVGGGFSSAQDWEGIVDELLIFRRSLNNTEISSVYNNQNSGKNWDGGNRACPLMPNMSLKKVSKVIFDPVNQGTNPKRIPGATVRYTVTAENAHASAAEGLVIKDDLNDEINNGSLVWLGNIMVTSPNINGGTTTSITDTTGDDQGHFDSNNILNVNCGDITDTTPCIVSYDVIVNNNP